MELPLRLALSQLEPELASALVGVGGIELSPPEVTRNDRERRAVSRVGAEGEQGTVTLSQDAGIAEAVGSLARVEIDGPQATDVAFALAYVLALLPIDLLAATASGARDAGERLLALRQLGHLLQGTTSARHQDTALASVRRATGDAAEYVATFARTLVDRLALPEPALAPPSALVLPLVPMEPLSDTISRFPASFRPRPLSAAASPFHLTGWSLTFRGTDVHLVHHEGVGCGWFDGPAAGEVALAFAGAFRYLPPELALVVATDARTEAFRVSALRALGLAARVPGGSVRDDPGYAAVLVRAQADPAPEVRALAVELLAPR